MIVGSSCAVVMDWSGTVVDDMDRAVRATNAVLREYRLSPLSRQEIRTRFCVSPTSFFGELGIPWGERARARVHWNRRILADRTVVLAPGARDVLLSAQSLRLPVIVVTSADVRRVALDARRLAIDDSLSIVVADAEDLAGELRALRADYPQLTYIGSVVSGIIAARDAGMVAFGYSGGWHSGPRLRSAGAEAVTARLDRSLPLRATSRRLFRADP